jgi:hypothetical protein
LLDLFHIGMISPCESSRGFWCLYLDFEGAWILEMARAVITLSCQKGALCIRVSSALHVVTLTKLTG